MEDDLGWGRGECVSGSRASQGKGTEYHGGSRGACGWRRGPYTTHRGAERTASSAGCTRAGNSHFRNTNGVGRL